MRSRLMMGLLLIALLALLPSTAAQSPATELIQPEDLTYIGAFRLPAHPDGMGWEYGGSAMTYYPAGDPAGPDDGFPGSLYATGHDWFQHVSEIAIPTPMLSRNIEDLPTVTVLQDFADIRGSLYAFDTFELPRVALEYLPPEGDQATGKLYFAWGQHFEDEGPPNTHGWAELDLSNPQPAGTWWLGDTWRYSNNDYIFAIDPAWAAQHTPGLLLVSGRYRDGGWSGQGPSLHAYGPWNDGNPPPSGTNLTITTLLQYDAVAWDIETSMMNSYAHPDEWNGGAWLTAGNRTAVIFAGTKAVGDAWYGFANGVVWPDEPPYPEVPEWPNDDRGWWATEFVAQILFYNPADFAAVAAGNLEPDEPQPYATLNVSDLLLNVRSPQQKYQLGAVAYDRERNLLYILELFGDEDRPLVHVWRVE